MYDTNVDMKSVPEKDTGWINTHFTDENDGGQSQWLTRWYYWTAPDFDAPGDFSTRRTIVRRGRFISLILLAYLIFTIPVTIAVPLAGFDMNLFYGTLLSEVTTLIILLFNRRGLTYFTGVVTIIFFTYGFIMPILALPNGLTPYYLPAYDLLIISIFVSAAIFPGKSVFLVAFLQCILICVMVYTQSQDAAMKEITETYGFGVVMRPILLHVIVAACCYLWTRNVGQATTRATRAERAAFLEHSLAKQTKLIAEQKNLLEHSIRQILDTHIRVANGETNARVPLTPDNVLWEVAGSLNNVLSRMQGMRQDSIELKKTKEEINELVMAIHAAKQGRGLIPVKTTGTAVDLIRQELAAVNQSGPLRKQVPPGKF